MKYTRWGEWEFDRDRLVLVHHAGYGYEIDLEECVSSAEVLDAIAQIEGKTWGTRECVGALVQALCSLLAPQATLCSWGRSKRLARGRISKLVLENELHALAHRRMDVEREERSRLDPSVRLMGMDLKEWVRLEDEAVAEVRRERDGVT